jgi:hypothetical protein
LITVDKAEGTPWTNGWHNVKVVRKMADGFVAVYFDDMEKPLMTARDKTFGAGPVGIGTFDDNGNFDDVELRGEAVAGVSDPGSPKQPASQRPATMDKGRTP